jgi:hypothetical protein
MFDINYIMISSILDTQNGKLENILSQAVGLPFDQIKVLDINNNFDVDNIKLGTVMDNANPTLKTILEQATGVGEGNFANVTLAQLASFTVNDITLNAVLADKTGNVIIDKLLDRNVKLGNIGSEINNLSLYEIYGESCFTKDNSKTNNLTLIYRKVVSGSTITYVLTDGTIAPNANNDLYYVQKNSGIWLLICFEATDIDAEIASANYGRPKTYIVSSAKIESLQSYETGGIGTISNKFMSATVRQLIDAGMLSSSLNSKIYNMSLAQAIEALSILNTTP